jgi:hypothetical protein
LQASASGDKQAEVEDLKIRALEAKLAAQKAASSSAAMSASRHDQAQILTREELLDRLRLEGERILKKRRSQIETLIKAQGKFTFFLCGFSFLLFFFTHFPQHGINCF